MSRDRHVQFLLWVVLFNIRNSSLRLLFKARPEILCRSPDAFSPQAV
jgi:hypothetical protein